jgi:type IV secretory pathway component VirB8
MSRERQEIAEKVRDGSYFKDAMAWYNSKYLAPITERSMVCVFFIAALCAVVPIVVLLSNVAATFIRLPFPMYVDDTTNYYTVIRPLVAQGEESQTTIAKYLIDDYIRSREEYFHKKVNAEKLRNLLKKMKFSSTKQVLNEYIGYMSETNPYSPLMRYKDHTDRVIDIKSYSFSGSDQTSGKANVVFDAKEISNDGTVKTSSWQVVMSYRLPDIAVISKTGAPLRFVVGHYRAKPLGVAQTGAEKKPSPEAVKENPVSAGQVTGNQQK